MDPKLEPVEPGSGIASQGDPDLPGVDIIELSADEENAIVSASKPLADIDPVNNAEGYIMEAQALAAAVPSRIRRAFLNFRRYGSASGGLVVRGLPVGTVPKTPVVANHAAGVQLEGARSMVVVTSILGDVYGYRAELGGLIIQNISPVKGREETQESVSSLEELLIHNETVFTQNRADYVALLCLRADHERCAATRLSSARQIVRYLTDREIGLLRQPIWATTVDGSFIRGAGINGTVLVGPISILEGCDIRPRFRCDFAETRPIDPHDDRAADVLRRLREVVLQCAIEVKLRESDLLVVDNHEAFHGRTSFVPRFDGWDRWLLRSFIVKDLSRSASDRPEDGRIIDRDYSQGPDVLWVGLPDQFRWAS